jgi:imidazolonepropionase-like amidohydrolase
MTWNPAKAIHRDATLGSIGVDREADVTILKVVDCRQNVEDSFGKTREVLQKIVPVGVLIAGVPFEIRD